MSNVWYRNVGKSAETVISTRIRLARNLSHLPFPAYMTPAQKKDLVSRVKEACDRLQGIEFRFIELSELPQRDIAALAERHLISTNFANAASGALLLSSDERVSIMINEEDHLRIQVLREGEDLKNAFSLAEKIDTALDKQLHFAYDDRLGYLTQCPTNLGTGMRASLMLHLPALQEFGIIQQIASTVSKLGLTVRGTYGEGSKVYGGLYQVSNQVTLGISEQAAIDNLIGIATQITQREETAREQWSRKESYEDLIWRSFGILQTARILTHSEGLELLSHVRLGVSQGILDSPNLETVTALMTDIQPGCLMADAGEDMSAQVRDRRRAQIVRIGMGITE